MLSDPIAVAPGRGEGDLGMNGLSLAGWGGDFKYLLTTGGKKANAGKKHETAEQTPIPYTMAAMNAATIKLYRASSAAEWADIQAIDAFRCIPSSMQGHWFAESAADAARWGNLLYPAGNQPFVVVEVEVPTAAADLLFRLPKLDNIGPARFGMTVNCL